MRRGVPDVKIHMTSQIKAPGRAPSVPGSGAGCRSRRAGRRPSALVLAFTLSLVLFPAEATGASSVLVQVGPAGSTPAAAPSPTPDPERQGEIRGTVLDRATDAPVVVAHVRISQLGRSDMTHSDGSFHFHRVPAGTYTLVVERIGYATIREDVTVEDGGLAQVTIRLTESAIRLPGMVVTATGRERRADQTYQPTSVLAGRELQRSLSWSLAATLGGEPGMALQTYGPAPAQPVIRGMGSDRVLVLEDGGRMGDLSHTAPDHAVGVDPIAADRIEVLRGPAGLLYGSNALGGVVNVIREEVPRRMPHHTSGTFSTQFESVNRGATVAGVVRAPVTGRVAVRGEGTYRQGRDIRTPLGDLEGTDSRGYNVGAGASWIPEWGFVGGSLRAYRLDYGIPGEFAGEQIPGAHPGGVDAETTRLLARFEAGHFQGLGPFSSVELDASFVSYLHQEIEGVVGSGDEGRRVLGAEFDQLTATAGLVARHDHEPGRRRLEGAMGTSFSWQDLLTRGFFPGSRSAVEHRVALYVYEELDLSPIRLQGGVRYDWTRVDPRDKSPIQTLDRSIPVDTRTFGDFSASVAVLREFSAGWTVGAGLARAFRTPAIPELFSDGPHLADFSFDIGNPELRSETGLGADIFVRLNRGTVNAELTAFRNRISNFIYYFPTGELDTRFFRFPVFEARGDDALFQGLDGKIQVEPVSRLVVEATASYVRATRIGDDDPLPQIPPLNGRVGLRYETPSWFATAGWRGAAAQERVPNPIPSPVEEGEFIVPERPTRSHGLVSLGAGYQWVVRGGVHSVVLQADNLLDEAWRSHLSRTKEVAPEPGRNVQLLYRISF
jgi:iron complex outermembrane recepter protein